jgi:hypothetical protein
MSWETYPANYRSAEVQALLSAARTGDCVSVVGLSGAGKSNLMGFIAERIESPGLRFILADCNRLPGRTPAALFHFLRRALDDSGPADSEMEALDSAIGRWLGAQGGVLAVLLDRFDALLEPPDPALFNNLRALRDSHKFQLAFVTATRRPLPADNEFAELVLANTVWLGPLTESDARWNVKRYAERKGLVWDEAIADLIINVSKGYPSFLRAGCEAYAAGATTFDAIAAHPAVQARLREFWNDQPTDDELRRSGLAGHPLLKKPRPSATMDTSQLTAKESLLLNYFLAHPDVVCEKDDLIRAAWPEDKVFERGVRDDSLAQLIRRLREKIEPDPASPRHIFTVPGRGYRFKL